MIKFEIREAVENDVDALTALAAGCFAVPWTARQMRNAVTGENSRILTAVTEDGVLCGMVALSWVLDEGSVDDVAAGPQFRRNGIARALLEDAEKLAGDIGLAFLTLEVRAGNAPAIALYEKCGYKTVGLRRGYYERPREDAVIMTKFLAEGIG